ncbi:chorismate mutase [Roseibium algae]|uniref:chorismate mutase n=1 Tax=Roseibium algae TaxID=3123038 RepID=A0ABU8TQW6_9HYPH
MSLSSDRETPLDGLRRRIDELDAELHKCLIERAQISVGIAAARLAGGATGVSFQPDHEAEVIRNVVERHEGSLPLTTVEHLWRELISASLTLQGEFTLHLDGSADLLGMLDLARFYFGFSSDLLPGADAADVVGSVAASECDLGLIALEDRAELPWWRGLSTDGAEVIARLPFLVLDDRPADMPALVISRAVAENVQRDTLVYDARWSGALPGDLMSEGLEVVSFHRSASGVDALLAVSADMSEDEIFAACAEAGAEPDVLRMIGGYSAPIDVEGDADEDFDTALAEG